MNEMDTPNIIITLLCVAAALYYVGGSWLGAILRNLPTIEFTTNSKPQPQEQLQVATQEPQLQAEDLSMATDPQIVSASCNAKVATQKLQSQFTKIATQQGAITTNKSAAIASATLRQHTLIAAKPGDGKTQLLNTLLIADIAAGHQAIVLNPQFAYWHPKDQPIDLRNLQDCFELVRDESKMPQVLEAIYAIGKNREPLYFNGEEVGHTISIIIDEWPRIVESNYGQACIDLVRKIVREHRKVEVFVTIAAQDGQVDTLGFKSGVRASFNAKFCGNVDRATWKALVGDLPMRPINRGEWMTDKGIITYQRPTANDIQALVSGIGISFEAVSGQEYQYSSQNTSIDTMTEPERYREAERLARETNLSSNEILRKLGGNRNNVLEVIRKAREEG